MTAGPDSSSHVIVIQICYLGSKNAGEAIVQAISSWAGERILLKDVEERSFLAQQDGVAKVLKGGAGRRWMIRGDLIGSLTDEVIGETVSRFQALGNRAVWLFELLGGALEDVEPSETCISGSQCQAKFIVAALQQWNDMEEDPRCEKSVDDWMRDIISTVSVGGPFPCFLERSEPLERVRGAFGAENFERLLRLKRQHDPHGIFKHTFANGLTKFVHLLDEPAGAAQSVEVEDATREKGLAHMDADTPLPMLGESIPASAAQE